MKVNGNEKVLMNVLRIKILKMFVDELGVIYTGGLKVEHVKDVWSGEYYGWRVYIYLNNVDKPMIIDYVGEDVNVFLDLVRKQIHEDSICNNVRFYSSSLVETNKAITDIRKEEGKCLEETK